MRCQDCEVLMADYLGEELGEGDRRRFEAHLKACDTCRAKVLAFQETLEQLARLETVSPSAALSAAGHLRVVRQRSALTRLVLSTLKVAAVLAIGVFLGRASVIPGQASVGPGRQQNTSTLSHAAGPSAAATGREAINGRRAASGRNPISGRGASNGRQATSTPSQAPIVLAAGQTPIHPRWIELGRKLQPGHSALVNQLLVLAQTTRRSP